MGAIFLVRHGQASFASADYDDLSPLGREQGRALGVALAGRQVQASVIVCGGLRRHAQTAQECLSGMGLPPSFEVDPGWDEYDHNEVLGGIDARFKSQAGLTAGLLGHEDPRRAFQAIFERAVARWVDGAFHAEYRESWPGFCARVEGGLDRVAARLGKAENALVFTSAGAISVVLRKLLGLADERTMLLSANLANASVTKLLVGARGLVLSTFNEHAHFEGEDNKRLISYR